MTNTHIDAYCFDASCMKFVAVERSSIYPESHDLEDPPSPRPFHPFYIRETLGETEEEVRGKLHAWLSSPDAISRYGKVLPSIQEGEGETLPVLVTNEHKFLWSYSFAIEPLGPVAKKMLFPKESLERMSFDYTLDN